MELVRGRLYEGNNLFNLNVSVQIWAASLLAFKSLRAMATASTHSCELSDTRA
jgi:hypothetical protein